ncbi:MAG: hypothetical protein HLUCCO16_17775 [Phormidium sp. OSCR]|nr:MAG: hypothetical protein HLUCCO16_17775 [Phormidium sp. OSCR]
MNPPRAIAHPSQEGKYLKNPLLGGAGGLSEVIAKVRCTLISFALEELIRTRKKRNLLDLSGQIQFSTDYDYKALRTNRNVSD